MNMPIRTFEAKAAVRERVPILVGLMGPSGSGKTYSALRLATGIQQVTGGDIFGIDTEARRMLHYADEFKFRHIPFDAPFGSLDYLAAIRFCVEQGARVIVVDSMTHEHTGPGGYLLTQEAEVQRMAGDDYAKRERVKMAGWIKPSGLRQQMINGILQLNVNFIFCFRAKEKTKPKKGGGIEEMGFMPIAGEDLLFEMTVNCLLPPKSGGVPQWRSDQVGERLMMKLPRQFESVFANSKPLDEGIGHALAEWARGDAPGQGAAQAAPAGVAGADIALTEGRTAAAEGTDKLKAWFGKLSPADRKRLKPILDADLKKTAEEADKQDVGFDDAPAAEPTGDPTTQDNPNPPPLVRNDAAEAGAPDPGGLRKSMTGEPGAPDTNTMPTDEATYKAYAGEKIAQASDGGALDAWFASPEERASRVACKVSNAASEALQARVKARAANLRRAS